MYLSRAPPSPYLLKKINMEEIKVKNYLYDYQKNSFKIKNELGKKKYYIKIKNKYLEVDEKI